MMWFDAVYAQKVLEIGDNVLVLTGSGTVTMGRWMPYDNLGFEWLTEASGWTDVICFTKVSIPERFLNKKL